MATLYMLAAVYADELKHEENKWVIFWKTGKSWHAVDLWRDPDTGAFEPRGRREAERILEEDRHAVILNGYYFSAKSLRGIKTKDVAEWIRWHYINQYRPLAKVLAEEEECERYAG